MRLTPALTAGTNFTKTSTLVMELRALDTYEQKPSAAIDF
jgi:hypothetical protein